MRRTTAVTSVVTLGLALAGAVTVNAAAQADAVPLAEGFDF